MQRHNTPSFLAITANCLLRGLGAGFIGALLLSLLVLLLAPAATAMATDFSELDTVQKPGDVQKGSLLFKHQGLLKDAPLLHTDVDIDVSGLIARTRLKQKFINTHDEWVEAIYVFPLPDDAAVDQLRMRIGERIIEGRIKERQVAKKVYEKAKQADKRASLVEQERPNIFTTSVANIGPREEITIEIEYQQNIRYDNRRFSLRFPMVVAPRFIPGSVRVKGFSGSGWGINTDEVADAERITPPVIHPDAGAINPVMIKIRLDSGFPLRNIMSPYHEIEIDQKNDHLYCVNLKAGSVPANRDFQLLWQAEQNQAPQAALFTEQFGNYNYAKLMVLPPDTGAAASLRREVVFVIDTSGSMGGTSIRQARAALLLALDRLKAGDSFNVIQFNSSTGQLYDRPQPFNRRTLAEARHYIQGLRAGGGTVMLPALQAALRQGTNGHDVRQVIFLTDGSVGNETALFEVIRREIGDTRLFTVGIGSAPNAYFMRRASRFGRGTYTYIGQVAEVQARMDELFVKLESAVMTDIRVHWPGTVEMWPQSIPDLYSGEPLVVVLQAESFPDTVRITGTVSGQSWASELQLQGGQQHSGVARLWAREKIAALNDQRQNGREAGQIKQLITEIALRHHLVSKYTSLVAVDVTPARVKEALLKSKALPVNLPAGWEYDKVFGALPQTATPAALNMLLGIFLLTVWLLTRLARRSV